MRRIHYIGWLGHRNLGDEAMYVACRRAFPEFEFSTDLPHEKEAAAARATPEQVDGVMLGGGTLIGWPLYRQSLASARSLFGNTPLFMLGTGVEDPSFHASFHARAAERVRRELIVWAFEVLPLFERVTVRGPLSQRILGEFGIPSDVVGDPALLLGPDSDEARFSERLLGVNVGGGVPWGGDPQTVLEQVVRLCSVMRERGWRLRFVPLSPTDLEYSTEAARRLGPPLELRAQYEDINEVLAAIRESHVFVGEKLHSVVLASAFFVPSLMLAYQPKCADFQASIKREAFTVRTDALDTSRLVELVDELAAHAEAHRAVLFEQVMERRQTLLAAIRKIRVSHFHLSPAPPGPTPDPAP